MSYREVYTRNAVLRRLYGVKKVPVANVGRAHPDYGLEPQEHERRKADRRAARATLTQAA